MRYQAGVRRDGSSNPSLRKVHSQRLDTTSRYLDVKNIGLRHGYRQAQIAQAIREERGVLMVLGQSCDIMLQRI